MKLLVVDNKVMVAEGLALLLERGPGVSDVRLAAGHPRQRFYHYWPHGLSALYHRQLFAKYNGWLFS